MSISLQTNYASMVAQNNLNINNQFQTQTITRLTSGYRINSSGDDAAGLAVANGFRSSVAELTQGVRNANDGVSTLQTIDGGLNNISMMLDRMKTLATESASSTFTGNRTTLDTEFQTLKTEIDRQANNIGLGSGNSVNAQSLSIYIGGGQSSSANATVSVALSAGSKVDSTTLGLTGNISGNTYSETAGSTVNLNVSTPFLVGASQVFAFTGIGTTSPRSVSVTVSGGSAGITSSQAVQSLNGQLSAFGITAGIDSNGHLNFSSGDTFALTADGAATGITGATAGGTAVASGTSTSNGLAAINAVTAAVQSLGNVQGIVGAGENKLGYAINLANSQITNLSAADSRIRDADVAAEAANLTKAQVLQQASIAAMAQANSAPQAVLALLKG